MQLQERILHLQEHAFHKEAGALLKGALLEYTPKAIQYPAHTQTSLKDPSRQSGVLTHVIEVHLPDSQGSMTINRSAIGRALLHAFSSFAPS